MTDRSDIGTRGFLSRRVFDRRLAVAMGVLAFAAQWYRHASFRSGAYDLAVFEQVVWKMAHGHGATSTLTAWNTFGDHFSPALILFVPLYRLVATPLWFFAAQAIAVAVGLLCVRPLVAAAGGDDKSKLATLLVVAFALNPAIWNAVMFDFHTTTLAVPVLLAGCIAGLRHQHRVQWLVVLGLILLRDDLAIAAVPLAFVGWATDTRVGRRNRVALASTGIAWLVIGAQLGTALGASRHFAARYGYLGTSMTDAATHPLHAFLGVVHHLVSTNNITPTVLLLLPLAFLPLGKPAWALLAGLMLLPTLLASDPNFHSSAFQYGAPIVPFLFLAAAGTLPKIKGEWRRRTLVLAAPVAALGFLGIGPPVTGTFTYPTASASDARAALETIRPDDTVVASNFMAPHLADRDVLIPFPYPFLSAQHNFPLDPRVTSKSAARQGMVDVIVVGKSTEEAQELTDRFVNDPVVARSFTKQQFGDVLVFRRNTSA